MSSKIQAVIVDDDPRLLKAYNLKFEKEGITAHVVGESINAIETIRNVMPNVVVLDVLMPVKSGWDILREMQSDAILKDIPVLLVSNIGSDDKEAEAVAAGATAYLVKSDTPLNDLIDRIISLSMG
jgi:DNA-binding response OmpR family regulator